MTLAFIELGLAALLRVAVPLLFPASHAAAMTASGLLWMVGFGLFAVLYAPVLLRPRVDGKPG
jgi:uncharacterized protein involved in response to NO